MKKVFLLISLVCFSYKYLNSQIELFGVATSGGSTSAYSGAGTGSIFKVDSNATNFSSQFFSTVINGYAPYNGSLLEADDGMIYGYSRRQTGWSMLILYQYDYHKNIYVEKYTSTSGLDGKEPMGALIQANNGLLYGLMNQGGVNNFGTLYSFNTVTNQFTKKIDFSISTGTYPEGSLFEASNGKLYGLARAGGLYNTGTMFEYNPVTNVITTLVDFDGTNANTGAAPKGTLTQGSDGLLYGMTTVGAGTASSVIIFSYDLSTNTFTKRKNFSASTGPWGLGTGSWPNDALIEGVDGNFYGLTMGNTGVWPCSGGTIFQFNPTTNTIITKYVFSLSLGTNPNGSLVLGTDGNFYGLTTNTLGSKTGSLFKYDYLNNVFTSKFYFDGYDYGGTPSGSLLQASNGKFYGTTREGGSSRSGGASRSYGHFV
jgi:uncharacterized repeat protein (TIGR03803 family)